MSCENSSCGGNCSRKPVCKSSCGKRPSCGASCGNACASNQDSAQCNQPFIGGIGASYRFALKGLNGAGKPQSSGVSFAVLVDQVMPGGPAERAGLLPEDSIIMVDGQPIVPSGNDLVETVVYMIEGAVGTTVSVTVERDTTEAQPVQLTFRMYRAYNEQSESFVCGPHVGAQAYTEGVPKCRACPFIEQDGRCIDCPKPFRVARAGLRPDQR